MIKLITSAHLCMIWRFHHDQQIYHFWEYLLASSNLTTWHLLKSHPGSPANSSRVTYPLGCFMTGIFYETTVGLSAPRGQTARQQRSEWMAHFLAVARWRGYSSSSLSSRLSLTRHPDGENLNECVKPLSASSASCTQHHMAHYYAATNLHRRRSRTSLKGDLFQRNWIKGS